MRILKQTLNPAGILVVLWCLTPWFGARAQDNGAGLTLAREDHWLYIRGPHLPPGGIQINYLEAYCRAGSTEGDWVSHTVIPY